VFFFFNRHRLTFLRGQTTGQSSVENLTVPQVQRQVRVCFMSILDLQIPNVPLWT